MVCGSVRLQSETTRWRIGLSLQRFMTDDLGSAKGAIKALKAVSSWNFQPSNFWWRFSMKTLFRRQTPEIKHFSVRVFNWFPSIERFNLNRKWLIIASSDSCPGNYKLSRIRQHSQSKGNRLVIDRQMRISSLESLSEKKAHWSQ